MRETDLICWMLFAFTKMSLPSRKRSAPDESSGESIKGVVSSRFNDPAISDMIIKCGDKTFHCSRGILASIEYFNQLFHSEWRESRSSMIEFSPEVISPSCLELYLRFVYGEEVTLDHLSFSECCTLFAETHFFNDQDWSDQMIANCWRIAKSVRDIVTHLRMTADYHADFSLGPPAVNLDVLRQLPLETIIYFMQRQHDEMMLTAILMWTAYHYQKTCEAERGEFEAKIKPHLDEYNLTPIVQRLSGYDVQAILRYSDCPVLQTFLLRIATLFHGRAASIYPATRYRLLASYKEIVDRVNYSVIDELTD